MPRSKHDVASSAPAKPASKPPKATKAPKAAKAPAGGKGAAAAALPVAKRLHKLSERARRLRNDPMTGISTRRLRVLALQCGVDAMQSGAKRAMLAILDATMRDMLQQALIIASGTKRRSLRPWHVTAAYARSSLQPQQLYLAPDDPVNDSGDGTRRKLRKAIKDGLRARRILRVPRASIEAHEAADTAAARAKPAQDEVEVFM